MVRLNVNLNTLLILGAAGFVGYKAYMLKKDFGDIGEDIQESIKGFGSAANEQILEIDAFFGGIPSEVGRFFLEGFFEESQQNYNWLEGADPNKFYGI
jgi:hypothetical protein